MVKTRFPKDPYAQREAESYDRPLPSREYILQELGDQSGPMTLRQLAALFGLEDPEDQELFSRRLRAMERDGQLIRNRRGGYGLVSKMDLIRGRVIGHPDGFGFLVPDEAGDDLFLSPKQMRSLLHGDRAVVRMMGYDRRGRREGAFVEVLERANHHVVGRYLVERGIAVVIPNNKRIHQDIAIPPELQGKAKDGQIVVAEIVEQPSWRSQPIGKVTEVLGDHLAPGMEIDIAIRSYELPIEWPPGVKKEARAFSEEVREQDKAKRVDIRHLPLVTIDGEDARDFDDAVYCEPHGKGWRLLVAIADVSHYVNKDSALDQEARLRGNSVYFPERVIPMLPEVLSNGLCSLNPAVDRLCMVCEMFITARGKVRKFNFFEGVMHSHARLTYNEVNTIVIDRKKTARQKRKDLLPHLDNLYELYQALRIQREKRGAIDFDTTETRIVFGEDRKIANIVPTERLDAHRMIEEYMVAANVAAADFLLDAEINALYRVHDGPGEEKLADVREFLGELGLSLGGHDGPEPRHYAKLLDSVRDRPDVHLIQTVLLRSLSQAMYTPDNTGHFGLAYDAYTHFTSPIRRYPDLLVHRAIRHVLRNKSVKRFGYSYEDMLGHGEHCSMTERRADEATRDAVDWLKCEYMQDKVGEVFDGIITGVTSFGVFVELDDIYVEGLVHVTSLQNDYYHFDPAKHRLVGERSRKIYRLTDKVRVQIMRVNLDDKKIDFELADERPAAAAKRKRRRKKRS
jgi:ribonuclease R